MFNSDKETTLEEKTNSESYTLKNINVYNKENERFLFMLMIKVVDASSVAISTAAVISIDSRCKFYQQHIIL